MNHDRIASLLATGLSASAVASIVGLSPSRIAQLQKEPMFADLLTAKLADVKEKDQEELNLGAKYLQAEHALIDQIVSLAPSAEFRDLTAALRVVAERQDKAKTRANPIMQGTPVFNTLVQVQLPDHAIPKAIVEMTNTREVIAVENRNLAPLSSKGVIDLFQNLQPKLPEGDKHEPKSSTQSSERSSEEAISAKVLKDGAKRFLDSLHPAPFAPNF